MRNILPNKPFLSIACRFVAVCVAISVKVQAGAISWVSASVAPAGFPGTLGSKLIESSAVIGLPSFPGQPAPTAVISSESATYVSNGVTLALNAIKTPAGGQYFSTAGTASFTSTFDVTVLANVLLKVSSSGGWTGLGGSGWDASLLSLSLKREGSETNLLSSFVPGQSDVKYPLSLTIGRYTLTAGASMTAALAFPISYGGAQLNLTMHAAGPVASLVWNSPMRTQVQGLPFPASIVGRDQWGADVPTALGNAQFSVLIDGKSPETPTPGTIATEGPWTGTLRIDSANPNCRLRAELAGLTADTGLFSVLPNIENNDADGDGLADQLEVALGLDPGIPSPSGRPTAGLNTYHYRRIAPGNGWSYALKVSDDLTSWVLGTNEFTIPKITPVPGEPLIENVEVTLSGGIPDRRFYKLEASLTP